MMRYLYTLLIVLLPFMSMAQSEPPRDESGKIIYKEVVPMEAAQKELYARALVAIPKDAKEVVRQEPEAVSWQDEKEFLVEGMGFKVPVKLYYSVILQEKDGRYMYSLTDLILEAKQGRGLTKTPVEEGSIYKPLPENMYTRQGTLKPQGQTILNMQLSYQDGIAKATNAEIERIKRVMALPIGEDW